MQGEQQLKELDWNNTDLFKRVWQKLGSPAPYSPTTVNFFTADRIYDLALYNYTHGNRTLPSSLTSQEMHDLEALAAKLVQSRNGDLLQQSAGDDANRVRAIAGRMLAGKVARQMRASLPPRQLRDLSQPKLSLIFGSQEPMVAFSVLAGLLHGGSSAAVFKRLPGHGAVMMFEAFSLVSGSDSDSDSYSGSGSSSVVDAPLPAESDLLVRFLYRNGTGPDAALAEHPLFGKGNSQRHMAYRDFLQAMDAVAVGSVPEWCHLCGAADLFCPMRDANGNPIGIGGGGGGNGGGNGNDGGPSAPAAGAIGVIATLTFVAAAVAAMMLCGGLRLVRRPGAGKDESRERGAGVFGGGGGGVSGGFKGAEKRQDDADISFRGGARHERSGSWELRNGGHDATTTPPQPSSSSTTTTTPAVPPPAVSPCSSVGASFVKGPHRDEDEAMRRDEMLDGDDTARLFHAMPVQPRSSL